MISLIEKEFFILEIVTELAYCIVLIIVFIIGFHYYWKEREKEFDKYDKKRDRLIEVGKKK